MTENCLQLYTTIAECWKNITHVTNFLNLWYNYITQLVKILLSYLVQTAINVWQNFIAIDVDDSASLAEHPCLNQCWFIIDIISTEFWPIWIFFAKMLFMIKKARSECMINIFMVSSYQRLPNILSHWHTSEGKLNKNCSGISPAKETIQMWNILMG